MTTYLIERENEQMLRTSKRDFVFPGGQKRTLEAYRVVWIWFDRIAKGGSFTEERMIEYLPNIAEENKTSLDEALGQLVEMILKAHDAENWDLTDDTLALTMARQGLESFYLRKKLGLRKPKTIKVSKQIQKRN